MKLLLLFCAATFAVSVTACEAKNMRGQESKPSTPVANSSGNSVSTSNSQNSSSNPGLEGKRWTLVSVTDGQGAKVDMPTGSKDAKVVFTFADGKVNVNGPCNLMGGTYTGGTSSSPLVIGTMRTTLMGCDPKVMDAEKKLAVMLAGPLQVQLETGDAAKLRLVTAGGETLSFEGKPTPESLYGPAKIIFLEVAPKHVPCSEANAEKMCLQVRDVFYDEHGLKSGEPGPWRPLQEKIEGFDHVEGQRNVVRVKSFSPPDKGNVYVLDMVVESGQ